MIGLTLSFYLRSISYLPNLPGLLPRRLFLTRGCARSFESELRSDEGEIGKIANPTVSVLQ